MGSPAAVVNRGPTLYGPTALPASTTEMVTISTTGALSSQAIPSGGVTDHGALTGLSDADHVAGSIAFTATDKLLGRSSSGSGAGEEIACTAAARSVLDDATVSAMVDTLGGASATGTGGLVRSTSPTVTTPILVGVNVFRQSGGVAGTDEVQISHTGSAGVIESKDGPEYFVSTTGDFFFDTTAGGTTGFVLQKSLARLYLGSSVTRIEMTGTCISYHSSTSAGTYQTFIHGNTLNSTFQNVAFYGISGLNGQFGGTNSAGSDLIIEGGRATGNAAGGKVTFQTCPAGSSGTTLQTPATCMQLDSNTTSGESRLLLLDITAGTVKRVSFGANDSGGTGYKVLRVAN